MYRQGSTSEPALAPTAAATSGLPVFRSLSAPKDRPVGAGTVLVTGPSGFLGSRLVRRLAGGGADVIGLKRSGSDLSRLAPLPNRVLLYDCDRGALDHAFRENRIDTVIHCATNYGRRPVPPSEVVEANLILPLKLLQLSVEHGVRAFINTDTILDKRISHYSLSKSQFTDWLGLFSHQIVCVNVAVEHFFGPFDDRTKFVTRLILDLLRGAQGIDLTPGEQRRDFIFVDDVVEAFVKIHEFAATAENSFHRFEIGSGRQIAIRDFVALVREATGNTATRLNFGALPYRLHEVMQSSVDTSALAALGWEPRVGLREGLERTVEAERKCLAEEPCPTP